MRRAGFAALAASALLAGLAAAGPARAQQGVAGSDAVVRIQQLEEEIRRLNGRIERLEHRLNLIARDGGARIGDLEGRVFDLEGGDSALLGAPKPLGELSAGAAAKTAGPVVAVSEQAAFDSARAAVEGPRPAEGRAQMQAFRRAYPDSPLTGRAVHWIAEGYFREGDYRQAAGVFFDNVEARPAGDMVSESLIGLALSLEKLGELGAACHALQEAPRREPDDLDAALDALLTQMLRCEPGAVRATKALVRAVGQQELGPLLDRAADDFAALARRPEAQAGMMAFLSREAPPWAR